MAESDDEDEVAAPRPFWSGTIAFGLVSLPVGLYAANRGRSVSLRMVDEDGVPLGRRYYAEQGDAALSADDIVRGFELDGDYVLVEDDELESIAPEKTRQIDLTRFVPVDELDPMYFERAYFLVPEEGSTKAYRLLAKAMEEEGRAGIATFVMREKEYLAAIVAEKGVLRLETLRFLDEVRQPDDIGLPAPTRVARETLASVKKALDELSSDRFDGSELSDRQATRLKALAARKLESGEDVHEIEAPEAAASGGDNVLDIVDILKQRLAGRSDKAASGTSAGADRGKPARKGADDASKRGGEGRRSSRTGGSSRSAAATKGSSRGSGARAAVEDMSKERLYERAQKLKIPGRSRMTREELAKAVAAKG